MSVPMHNFKVVLLLAAVSASFLLNSCGQKYDSNNFQAYFGGEISNPTKRFVLFCKDNEVLDTIYLKDDNTFFKEFDSLKPGIYTFRHDPEYQYVYFDKNDSLMVNINTRDFDESIVFCGRGDRKNNFLMELYLLNEKANDDLYPMFDQDPQTYITHIDSAYRTTKQFYNRHKDKIEWGEGFDLYAKAMVDFNYYTTKEIYPRIHHIRTGKKVNLPADFYNYRNEIDFNDAALAGYSPFLTYLSHLLTNLAAVPASGELNQVDLALQTSIRKLHIADTLLKSPKIKNTILNSIAFGYLLEDQHIVNNQTFLDSYMKFSTDQTSKNEITEIGRAVNALRPGQPLPSAGLITIDGKAIDSDEVINGQETVFFFWTENMHSHFLLASKRALAIKSAFPNLRIVAVNLDSDSEKWRKTLQNYNVPDVIQVQAANYSDISKKWALIKIHRTIVVTKNGTIKEAFTNLFDAHFEQVLRGNGDIQ
ncbi:MAG: hypothetical protein ITG00_02550 [Flavobacterium sp.]|nr:hypothetical protein [Flavobacterium sp.]